MLLKIIMVFLIIALNVFAQDFKQGEKIFNAKCSSCHAGHIDINVIKENFFEKDNKILNLKVPSVNMLSYAIMDGPKKIGDPNDTEMRQIEIEEYLKKYLAKPDKFYSICDEHILKYYIDKKPMTISDKEAEALAIYFMQYKQNWEASNPQNKNFTKSFNEMDILKLAQEQNKNIIIMATSQTCHFCKKMKKEVLGLDDVKKRIDKNYVMVEVDVDNYTLPFDLQKIYKKITPTFFFLNKDGEFHKQYFGAWKKDEFMDILNEENVK